VGSFIRIGPGIEEGEPSSCVGAPRGVVLGGHKILSPPCVNIYSDLKTYLSRETSIACSYAGVAAVRDRSRLALNERYAAVVEYTLSSLCSQGQLLVQEQAAQPRTPRKFVATLQLPLRYHSVSVACLLLRIGAQTQPDQLQASNALSVNLVACR
jgi:hypothetical protein